MNFGLIIKPEVKLYTSACETKETEKGIRSNMTDQALYGCGCRIVEVYGAWLRIITDYGYSGFIHSEDIMSVSEENIKAYYASTLCTVNGAALDIMDAPTVSASCLLTVPGGAVLRYPDKCHSEDGWARVMLADGREGYVTEVHLEPRLAGSGFIFRNEKETLEILEKASGRDRSVSGGCDFDFTAFLNSKYNGDESLFRTALTAAALRYLGVQYRWGGRSSQGLDCSGLVSMSYLRCGIEIYRDAAIADGFPMRRIDYTDKQSLFNTEDELLRPGDAIYFPGHIAMYLGNGKYIHSTGRKGDNGVVINSMRENDPEYRADLLESMYAAAGIR